MRNLIIFIVSALFLAVCLVARGRGETYRGTYTDGSGVYAAPAASNVQKDGSAWTAANLAFSNASSAAGGDRPGAVLVTLSNITSAGDYAVFARDAAGTWHTLELRHEPAVPATLSMSSYSGIDARLSSGHGAGLWSAEGSVTVLPFQGGVSYETASWGADVHVTRGDSVAIPYSTGSDITGWEVWFAAKASPADDTYAIGPVDVTAFVTDPAAGAGLISLSASQADVAPRRYAAELELRKQGQVATPLRFYLWVDPDVIR